jgi:nitroreductase
MDVMDCIMLRRSVRKYTNKPVEWEKVGKLIYAARAAPSSGNVQNWRFIIVNDDGLKQSIGDACSGQVWVANAPVIIAVVADVKKAVQFYGVRGERLYSIQNCAAAIQNILLTAVDLGLGACWVGAFDENLVGDLLGIPDDKRLQALITVGYPAQKPVEPEWRQEMYTITFLNSYGGRMKDINHVLGYHSDKVQKVLNLGREGVDKGVKSGQSAFKKVFDKSKSLFKKKE